MQNERNDNTLIMLINVAGALLAYGLLGASLYLSTEVPLSTKGYWGMGVLMLTISLINVVKYRFDWRSSEDRIRRIEGGVLDFGSDMTADENPLEMGLDRLIGWDKADFLGKRALEKLHQLGEHLSASDGAVARRPSSPESEQVAGRLGRSLHVLSRHRSSRQKSACSYISALLTKLLPGHV